MVLAPRHELPRLAAFRRRLRAVYGPRMRVVWDSVRNRWVLEEFGHRTHQWQHVWHIEGPGGQHREPGDWVFERLREMDRMCALSGLHGLKKLSDVTWGPRIDQARRATGARRDLFYQALDKAKWFFNERRHYAAAHIPSKEEAAFKALPRKARRAILQHVRTRMAGAPHGPG